MAFYRCGGGSGIPSQVNTDMNNVLNKKFSTSGQTYPPLEWADDVNLLGLLEEKTASSASICSFSDGADDVPMSSVIAHIAPTLTGVNAVNMVQTGKNLFNYEAVEAFNANVIITRSDGDYTMQNNNSYGVGAFRGILFHLKPARYTLSFGEAISVPIRIYKDGSWFNNGINAGNTSCTFTVTEEADYDFSCNVSANSSLTIKKCQFEVGSTATAYEAYEAPTSYTANLGRTVYGADVDLVSGQGTETYGYIDLGSLNWVKVTSGQTPYFSTTTALSPSYKWASQNKNVQCNNYSYASIGSTGSAEGFFVTDGSYVRIRDANYESMTADKFKTAITGTILVYELATGTDFTFDGQEIPSLLGVNNLWHDAGETEAVYRSSGTVTPVVPTLISKTITDNGTYDAEDDDADGYSSVTVSVSGGSAFTPMFSETLIADNSSHASSFTLTEDYANYDMVKIVWYESASSSGFLYTTPDILDEIFSIGVGKLCINKPSTNYYICYSKSGLTWTQTNQRNIYVHEIYGVTFTNCTMTATDLYKRGASTTTRYAITSQTSLKDYDLFMMASIHATDGSETMPTTWLYQYPKENMSDAFDCPVPTVLQEYNANDEAFVISEYGMTAARYFMVQGIVFTPSTSNLLSMGGLTSSNEEPTEPENNEEEEEE